MINEFRKVTGHKINIQKSFAFLFTNNEVVEREINKTIPFIIVPEGIRYLGANLIKEVKNHLFKNYKTLMKEIEDDTNKWKNISYLWTGRINIVKISLLSKAI